MPEDSTKLSTFLSSLEASLSQEENDPWELYYHAIQYPFLEEALLVNKNELSQAFLSNDKQKVRSLLSDAALRVRRTIAAIPKQTPQLKIPIENQEPVATIDPQALKTHVQNLENARTDTQRAIHTLHGKTQGEINRKWIEKVVDNWVKNIPREQQLETKTALSGSIEKTITDNPTADASIIITNAVQDAQVKVGRSLPALSQNQEIIRAYSKINKNSEEQIQQRIVEAVLSSSDPTNFSQNLATQLSTQKGVNPNILPIVISGVVKKTNNITGAAQVFSVRETDLQEKIVDLGGVFQAIVPAWQKPAAFIADGIISVFGIDKTVAIRHILTSTWEREKNNFEKLLGNAFTNPLVQNAINKGNSAIGQKSGGASVLTGPSRVVMDVFTSVFKPEISDAYFHAMLNTQQGRTVKAVTWQQIYAMQMPGIGGLLADWGLSKIGGFATKKVAMEGAKKVGSSALGTVLSSIGKKGLSATLAGAFGLPAGPIGVVAGAAIGLILEKVGGLFVGAARGIGSLLSGGVFVRLMAGDFQLDWKKDWSLLLAAGCVAPILIFFILPTFFNTPMMSEGVRTSSMAVGLSGGEDVGLETGSKYISITKTPSPSSFAEAPGTITYTISISATETDLSNVSITDEFSVYGSGSSSTLSAPDISAPSTIAVGSPFITTFSVTPDSSLRNAVIVNSLTVVADAGEAIGETKTTAAIVTIGTAATSCFEPAASGGNNNSCGSGTATSSWEPGEWAIVASAIQQLLRSPSYMNLVCSGGSIPVYRVRTTYGGGCYQGGAIYVYNGGVSSYGSSVYTMAHESGHVVNARTDLFNTFLSEGISAQEGYLPTYPNDKSDGEDFAETLGLYVGHAFYYPSKWSAYPHYPESFPKHYNFAKQYFGIEY